MREEEGDIPRSDAMMYSLVEYLDCLLLRLKSTAHSVWILAQEIKDTTKHTNKNIIIERNPLNRSRRIKINDALTHTFIESEPAVVYINRIKDEAYNQALMSISSPWVNIQVQA